MKNLFLFLVILITQNAFSQKTPEDFGYKHINTPFQNDSVHFIVKSKVGEEFKKKPILIFIQGSLAKPLIKYSENGSYYPPFPFDETIFTDMFHLICINKPNIPMVMDASDLGKNGQFIDSTTNLPPTKYTEKANLTYYTQRNTHIVDYLIQQDWVDKNIVVVAGHSEGSSIAVKMAANNNNITHLIYSGGTPYYSRILSMITQDRKLENVKESWVEKDFDYWKRVNANPDEDTRDKGYNSNKSTYSFSENLNDDIKKLEIPVLISYGTEDTACPFNDLLRIETIQANKTNITFRTYINREHNYFALNEDKKIDYNMFGWDIVGKDWLKWLIEN